MTALEHGYEVELVESSECGGEFATFRFTKPDGYVHRPGQYLSLGIETAGGVDRRFLSHVDAPHEGHIEVGTRLTGSPFKQALAAMRAGDHATIAGPRGRFGLPETMSGAAFLAGGIGITPVVSILRDAVMTRPSLDAAVFHGNGSAVCRPYADELFELTRRLPGLRVIEVIENPEADYEGERGLLTEEVVRRHLDSFGTRAWAVSGPPAMVEAMKRVTRELGLAPDAVRYESFAGYAV